MNKILTVIALVAAMALTSCGGGQKPSQRVRSVQTEKSDSAVKKVAFTKAGLNKTPEIHVTMNGVPFKMLWDTGATITVISSQELGQLVKDGAVNDADILGEMRVVVADGSSVKVPVINIRELTIATDGEPYVVNNVQVTVVSDPSASLLLGQNVMKELPKYSINEAEQTFDFEDK